MDGLNQRKSNYVNYRWMPEQTIPFARSIQRHLGLTRESVVLDFGAARGYLVKALRMLDVIAFGYDISKWAVENCDPAVKEWMGNQLMIGPDIYDWILAKDVFEHIHTDELRLILSKLLLASRHGLFIVVPLVYKTGGDFVREEDRADVTHEQRLTLVEWMDLLKAAAPPAHVSAAFHVPGVKPAAEPYPHSCGFFTVRKI